MIYTQLQQVQLITSWNVSLIIERVAYWYAPVTLRLTKIVGVHPLVWYGRVGWTSGENINKYELTDLNFFIVELLFKMFIP